jgi:hypothetical protein
MVETATGFIEDINIWQFIWVKSQSFVDVQLVSSI